MNITLSPSHKLSGSPTIPGDKSISHRALIFGALAEGTTEITQLLTSHDVISTWKCLEKLGVQITRKLPRDSIQPLDLRSSLNSHSLYYPDPDSRIWVKGLGIRGLQPPLNIQEGLDCGNSGTTIRLLMGVLAGHSFPSTLCGDASLSKRPMKRIATPLQKMGARISLEEGQFAPVQIQGKETLDPLHYELPVASAQLKSALLLAGLYTHQKISTLSGKIKSRDHTERLLQHFGVDLGISDHSISIRGGQTLTATQVAVPGDISSAAYWIAASLLIPGSFIEIKNVSLNPSRIGIISVLKRMGAQIEYEVLNTSDSPEPMGTIQARFSHLQGTTVLSHEIPSLIDELPLLAVVATFAEGVTLVQGAEELRVKETDRLEAVAINLKAMGAEIHTNRDGFEIRGPQKLKGGHVQSFHDHRIAMAFSIAALGAEGATEIQDCECVEISYPNFFETLDSLIAS